ncbi:hypothetical protein [Yoonia sp. SS1-5]|uniref:Uncharacterized protein n=1 Tax=Yoonia rhodophyticola TaxID=3137370 RepID=A0AAN0MAP1_9RHOB
MTRITLKKRALETLRHANIGRINFQYGRLHVYPHQFARIAELIEADHISYRSANGNHYDPTPERGQRHYIGVHSSLGRDENGTLVAVNPFLPSSRGTIVHEACHATHDYQRVTVRHGDSILPRQFEGAATLAGWMTALLWGFDQAPSPQTDTMRLAAEKARLVLDGTIGPRIDADTVRELDAAVATGSANMYVFNGT